MSIRPREPIVNPRAPEEARAAMAGIVSRSHLAELGLTTSARIREAINDGQLERLSRGTYALPHAHANFRTAARKNARLACISACAMYGLWVREPSNLHVAISKAHCSPSGTNVTLHRMAHPPAAPIVDLRTALAQMCSCTDAETALIALESALNQRLISEDDLPELTASAPAKAQKTLARAVASSQSGSESRVRNFLQSLRVHVRAQVPISGVGFVDLLVGKSLIIECDSRAHHTTPADYHNDRERDAAATLLGYTVVRLSYEQIWNDWDGTKQFLLQLIRTRAHRRPPRVL